MSLGFAVQKAVKTALTAPLAALTPSVPVVDHAPQGQSYPFVQIGRWIETRDDMLAEDLSRFQIALTVFSVYRGKKQVHTILDTIRAALDRTKPALETGRCLDVVHDRSDVVIDQDGVTYTGTALYTLIVTP